MRFDLKAERTDPMIYGPKPSPMFATNVFRIPASLNPAICSGVGPWAPPEKAEGGPAALID